MMPAAVEYDLRDLLEQAGAAPPRHGRGKWQCPNHHGSPSLSVDPARGLFNCHHPGCDFRGNSFTLARALGLTRRLPREDYLRLRREREQARKAAQWLAGRVQERRWQLDQAHRDSLGAILWAHAAGPNCELGWSALEWAYERLPRIRGELLAFEVASARNALEILDNGLYREALIFAAMAKDDGLAPMVDEAHLAAGEKGGAMKPNRSPAAPTERERTSARLYAKRGSDGDAVVAPVMPALVASPLPPHHQRGVLGPVHPHTPQRMVSK
jgi:hypothetical protein